MQAFSHAGPATWNALPDHIRTLADPVNFRQEAQLSPSDCAMRRVSRNLANYHATVQKRLVRQVLNKSKL